MPSYIITYYLLLSLPIIHLVYWTQVVQATISFHPVIRPGAGCEDSCPTRSVVQSLQEKNVDKSTIRSAIDSAISSFVQEAIDLGTPVLVPECGEGKWKRIASLNMNNSAQHCPSAWTEIYINGTRGCGRPPSNTSTGGCSATLLSPRREMYQNVCGRVIGYEYGSADAFLNRWNNQILDVPYVYGVSVTHGSPRNHIWTYAAGLTEGAYFDKSVNCPCAHPTNKMNSAIPSFVGNNYYCESGNPGPRWENNFLYNTDPLWDGKQCEGECCDNGKSPPWFSVKLPNPTTDDIEVRICSLEPTYQDTIIQLLEVYIQ